jgi:hypothetical protein
VPGWHFGLVGRGFAAEKAKYRYILNQRDYKQWFVKAPMKERVDTPLEWTEIVFLFAMAGRR